MTATHTLFAIACIAALTACGGGGVPATDPDVAGIYVLDVDRTVGLSAKPRLAAAMRQDMGRDSYRVALAPGGTFRMRIAMGEGFLVVNGRWVHGPDGSFLRTIDIDGVPPEEGSQVDSPFVVEPGYLILTEGAQRIVLRRLE